MKAEIEGQHREHKVALITPYPVVGDEKYLRPFQGDPEASQEARNHLCPFSLWTRGKHANTTHQTAPERNTTTTSPHTTADNDGLPEAHAADGDWACAAGASFHSTACRSYFPFCNLSPK